MGMRGYGFLRVGGREQQAFLEVPEPVPDRVSCWCGYARPG